MAAGRKALNVMESEQEKKRARAKRKKNMSEIARISALAREQGMSYGQYVSKYRM